VTKYAAGICMGSGAFWPIRGHERPALHRPALSDLNPGLICPRAVRDWESLVVGGDCSQDDSGSVSNRSILRQYHSLWLINVNNDLNQTNQIVKTRKKIDIYMGKRRSINQLAVE
jgi:hypothetical protein